MTLLADLLGSVFELRYRPFAAQRPDDRPVEDLARSLLGPHGEAAGSAIARQILDRYGAMDDAGKLAFFRFLATHLAVDTVRMREALSAYEASQSRETYRALMTAAEPPRQELIRRLNQVAGATSLLVHMRADLLRLAGEDPALAALDVDFRHLFSSWFNRGFLVLRPISWESPAHILEKIIAYEAVHTIESWSDLRRRLEPADRRCFAFFHPAMPDDPLIFVEVALTAGVPGSIQELLAEDRTPIDPADTDAAVFYSISNCQAGLAGISFGNSLIKQVAADLSAAVPGLKTFVTLSPIPGLCRWIEAEGLGVPAEAAELRRLAARYLMSAKRADGQPLDRVARFHLGNGAIIHQLHARGDTSDKGLAQSAGAMVNYLYDLSNVAQNQERYAAHREIAASLDVRSLVAAADKVRA